MADNPKISQIKLPNGSTYDIKDNISGYTNNTGTITSVKTTVGAHTAINVSSGAAEFNVPTKTSHLINDSGFLTSSDLASVLRYKGTKASVADVINISNPSTGDVWHVTADSSEYAYDGNIWQELGTAIDLSGYALKSEIPTVSYPVTSVNNKTGAVSLTYSDVSAASSSHTHGNITNGGDITATAPTIANGDQLIINDNSASKITNGPTFDGSTTTTALTPKGTWESFSKFSGSYTDLTNKPTIPTDTNTWRTIQVNDSDILGSGINTGKLNLKAGTNVSITNSSGTVTISATDTNTDEKLKWTATTLSNTYYPLQSTSAATTSTANTLNSVSFYQYYNTAGGYRRFILGNTTAYTSSGGAYGTIRLYGTGATYYGDLNPGTIGANSLTANRTWTLPNKTGTIALTSDIPTIPTNVSAFTNDAGYITSADVPEGASAYTGTISAVTSGNASAGSNNGFARGDHVHNITKTTITNALGYTPADILIGNTRNVTPTQVLTALQAGKTVYITHEVDTDLIIYATYFDYANTLSIIVSSVLVEVSGVYYVYILTGNISTNTWSVSNTALAKNSSIPTVTNSNTTGITASTTATKTTLGTASSIYGVKSGTNSTTTASKASGSNGSASNWVFENVACDDITAWSAGSGSASFSATVSSHVLSFSHSHTHTAPSLTYSAKTASHVKSGGNGTAPSWSFTDVTVPIRADSATSVPNVSVASATVSITDPGHTHQLSN